MFCRVARPRIEGLGSLYVPLAQHQGFSSTLASMARKSGRAGRCERQVSSAVRHCWKAGLVDIPACVLPPAGTGLVVAPPANGEGEGEMAPMVLNRGMSARVWVHGPLTVGSGVNIADWPGAKVPTLVVDELLE